MGVEVLTWIHEATEGFRRRVLEAILDLEIKGEKTTLAKLQLEVERSSRLTSSLKKLERIGVINHIKVRQRKLYNVTLLGALSLANHYIQLATYELENKHSDPSALCSAEALRYFIQYVLGDLLLDATNKFPGQRHQLYDLYTRLHGLVPRLNEIKIEVLRSAAQSSLYEKRRFLEAISECSDILLKTCLQLYTYIRLAGGRVNTPKEEIEKLADTFFKTLEQYIKEDYAEKLRLLFRKKIIPLLMENR